MRSTSKVSEILHETRTGGRCGHQLNERTGARSRVIDDDQVKIHVTLAT